MNRDLKSLLQLVIRAGIEQGILGRSSRVCRKPRVDSDKGADPQDKQNEQGKEE